MSRPPFVPLLTTVMLATCLQGRADEGGISIQTGETLFLGGSSLATLYLFTRSENGEQREHTAVVGAGYGVSERLTLGLVVPHRWLKAEGDAGTVSSSGLGDVTVLGKCRLFFHGGERTETTAAAVLGVQLPTGRTDIRNDGVPLDPELQPGSGSFDVIAGFATTHEWDDYEISAFLIHQFNTEGAHDFRHGDLLTAGAALGWRPWVEKYPGPELGLTIKLWYEYEGHAARDRRDLPGTGGWIVFAAPGIWLAPRTGIKFGVSADLPMAQDQRGHGHEFDLRMSFAVSWIF